MKRAFLWLGGLALILAAVPTDAASTCTISATVCKGQAYVDTTTGGLLGALRCFFLDTDSTLGNHVCSSTQDRATWEMNAGACVTLFYFDVTQGATPPATPNKVTLAVKVDNGATTTITLLSAGAEPASGSSFTFCATSTGVSGAAARTGTWRIYLNPVKDDGVGGVGNYDIDSDGTATVGTIVQNAKGALRGNMLVSALTASSPPAGSFFAYGPAGNEQVTLTATRDQQNDGLAADTVSFDTRHASGGSIVETSSAAQSASAATDSAAFTIDNTYDAAQTTYDIEYNIAGTATLTGLSWTTFPASGHGSGISQISATKVRATARFTADPRIVLDKDGVGTFATGDDLAVVKLGSSSGAAVSLLNRGESVYEEWFIFNARSEKLSRAMTFEADDPTPTTCTSFGSLTPASNKYSFTHTVATATCTAAFDTVGTTRTLLATNTDQSHRSGVVFRVSSFLFTDAHTQKASTLVKDDWPMPNANEDSTFIISSDTTNLWCHIEGVRLDGTHIDTPANAVTLKVTETDDTTVLGTKTTDTDSTGWTAPDSQRLSVAPAAPSRIVHAHCDATFNGNTASDSQSISWISAYTADKSCPVLISPKPAPGVTSRIWIHNEKLQTPIVPDQIPLVLISKIAAAAWVDADHLTGTVKNAVDNTATVNGALYYQDWTPTATEDDNLLVVCYVEGVTIQQSQAVHVAPPTGGDPLKVFAGPIDGLPNENVLLSISESYTDGTARTGNAAGTSIYVYKPDNTLLVNAATPTEVAYGAYRYSFNLGANPMEGSYLIVVKTLDPTTSAPIGTSNAFVVHNMNPNVILPASIDLGGSAIPSYVSLAIFAFFIGALLVAAILLARLDDAATNILGSAVAFLAGLLALTLGFTFTARIVLALACFVTGAWSIIAGSIRLLQRRALARQKRDEEEEFDLGT